MRDKLYLVGFLSFAGLLLFLGRPMVKESALLTELLTFGASTTVGVLGLLLYRLQLQLKASRKELARKEAEISIAHEVQRALFPRQFPCGGGLEFSAICIPAGGISGDFYDALQLPDGRQAFAIADISGKGISAALLMANLQALLRVLANAGPEPGEVCRQLNDHLHQVTDASKFATFFYANWQPSTRQLTYVNAGHNAPFLLGNHRRQRLEEGGMPLGMFPQAQFRTGEITFQPGELLVLYSDGLTEATNAKGQEFGDSQLESLVSTHCHRPLPEIQQMVLESVQRWASNQLDDDLTLVLVRSISQDSATQP
ncbi:MAG: PP2C family protein-serine/threonine phosphatase [Terriglobia bacterium]